jgi:hypothetical protein
MLSQEQLDEITEFAKGMMSPKKICTIMSLDYKQFKEEFTDQDSDVYKAYHKGTLLLEYELNVLNIKFAKQSSSHAMNKVLAQLESLYLTILKENE